MAHVMQQVDCCIDRSYILDDKYSFTSRLAHFALPRMGFDEIENMSERFRVEVLIVAGDKVRPESVALES